MIKNLIYDFGKVLIDYDFHGQLKEMFDDKCDVDGFIRLVKTREQQRREDRGDEPFEEMCELLKADFPGFEHELEIYKHNYTRLVTGEIPGMYELLKELKNRGYRLYGLSNWCNQIYKTMRQFPVFELLDGFVISSDIKIIKPEAEIYQHILSKYGLKAEECLFADDKAENIEAALAEGMDAVIFTDCGQYMEDLRARAIL